MGELSSYLEQLGLSEVEVKLYLSLIETGPIKVRDLAKTTGIKRTTAYIYIDQLVEKGLIMKLVQGSNKLVAAHDPQETLQQLMKTKLEKAKEMQNQLPSVLQTLSTSLPQFKYNTDAEIKYYKGIHAVKKIYEEAFAGREFRSYVKVEEQPVLSTDNPDLFGNAFKHNKNLKVWEIMYDSPASRKQAFKLLSETSNYFYKFMPKDVKWSLTSEDILIYDGKVVLINYKGNVSSVVLQSADYYNNSKELFDFIWRMLPDATI